jgi:signal transduction histidine kinase
MSEFRARAITIGLNVSWLAVGVLVLESIRLNVLSQPTTRTATIGVAVMLAALNFIRWESVVDTFLGKLLLVLWAAVMFSALGTALAVEELATAVLGLYLATIVFVAIIGRTQTLMVATFIAISSYLLIPVLKGHTQSVASLAVPAIAIGGVAIVTRGTTIALARSLRTVVYQQDKLERNTANFERLYEVSRTIAAGENLEHVLPELVGRIGSYLDAEVGLILLHDNAAASLRVVSPIWAAGHSLEVAVYRIGLQTRDPLGRIFRSKQPEIVTRIDENSDELGILGELGLTNAIAVNLRVDRTALGMMVLGDKRTGVWSETDLADLVSFAAPAALVLAQVDRYADMAMAGKRMEDVARLKSEFVSVVSHELRTPLTSIIGALATLARPELVPETPAAVELLTSVRNQTDRLRRLIEDLLMVSRIDNGAIPQHPSDVNVGHLIDSVIGEIPGASELVTFTVHDRVTRIEIDPDHLHRVLINLVQNAIKYAPDSAIKVSAVPKGGGQISLVIADHGSGISAHHRRTEFDRFTQLEPSDTRSQGGTGLGLHIVHGLVTSMGGHIDISDTPGGGTTFTVVLPRSAGIVPSPIQVSR